MDTPKPKVAAAGLSGAATTILILIVTQAGVELGPTEAGAVATLVAFAAGYLKGDTADLALDDPDYRDPEDPPVQLPLREAVPLEAHTHLQDPEDAA